MNDEDRAALDTAAPPPGAWPLAGRQEARGLIRAAVEDLGRLESGGPRARERFILLSSPAGGGKSRLLAETERYSRKIGLPVVLLSCRRLWAQPLGIVTAMVQTLLRRLASSFNAGPEYLGLLKTYRTLIQRLTGEGGRGNSGQTGYHDEQAIWLQEQIPPFLTRLSAVQPFVLALDDVQDADVASAACLDRLLRHGEDGSYLAVLSGSPGRMRQLASVEPGGAEITQMELPPLTPQEIASLLAGISGRFGQPQALAGELHRLTAGLPGHLELVLPRWLTMAPPEIPLTTGILRRMDLPATLREMAAAQLDACSQEETGLLQFLSVAREGMTPRDLDSLLSKRFSSESVQVCLESLRYKGMVRLQADFQQRDRCTGTIRRRASQLSPGGGRADGPGSPLGPGRRPSGILLPRPGAGGPPVPHGPHPPSP
ncbi:MAG: AAA family ATPase [Acidobacteriota bacterium]